MPILGLCQWRTIPTRRPAPTIARRLPVPDKAMVQITQVSMTVTPRFLANCFFGGGPAKGKSENRRVFIGDLMVGLGGLEPPTSPLSGAFMVLYA